MEICQIPHVIFGSTSQSSFRFTSIFSATKHSSSVLSKFKHYRLWLKAIRWRANFWDLWVLRCQNSLNSSCQFWTNKSIPLQILHHSPVSWRITPLYFVAQILYTLVKGSPLKGKFVRLLSAWVKIGQIHYVNFETTSHFLFKFFINLQCHYA